MLIKCSGRDRYMKMKQTGVACIRNTFVINILYKIDSNGRSWLKQNKTKIKKKIRKVNKKRIK